MKSFSLFSKMVFSLLFILNGISTLKADTYFTTNQLTYTYDYLDGSIIIEYLELEEAGEDDQMIRATLYYQDASGRYQLLFDRGYNSQWPGTTNNPDIEQIASRYSGDKRYSRFKWKKIPSTRLGKNIVFKFDFDWDIDDDQSWGGQYDDSYYKYVNAYSTGAPYSITVSQNECNEIQLNWSNPNLFGIDESKYSIYIYRNNLLLTNGGLTGTTTAYTDMTPEDGSTYSYYILTYMKANFSTHINQSGYVYGKSKPQPSKPYFLTLTENTCEKEVNISWRMPNLINVSTLVLERSTSNNFANPDETINLNKNDESYSDPVQATSSNQPYYYRLRPLNDCGEGPEIINNISPEFEITENIAIDGYSISSSNGDVLLQWGDLSCYNPSKVSLIKGIEGGVPGTPINIPLGNLYYLDKNVSPCVEYLYTLEVESQNPFATYTSDVLPVSRQGNIDNVLVTFDASKGYYSDKVILNWSVQDEDQIDKVEILRRVYGGQVYELVHSADNTTKSWIDQTTEANLYYEYEIIAVTNCVDSEIKSNPITTVGFRQPRGTVTGQITYEGGTAVQGVKVQVNSNRPGISQGTCLELDGETIITSSKEIPNSDFSQGFTVEAWYNYSTFDNFPYVFRNDADLIFAYFSNEEFDFATGEYVKIDPQLEFYTGFSIMKYDISTVHIFGTDTIKLWKDGDWNHISLNYNSDTTKIFINGRLALKSESAKLENFAFANTFGDNVVGFIDEARLWNRSLSNEETARYYNMVTSGTEEGLIINYHFDEGFGKFAFDASKNKNGFNGNHGDILNEDYSIINSTTFSDNILDATLLSRHAYTNNAGSYVINGIPYRDEGELFRVTPIFGQHSFDPPTKTRFIGDGEYVHNEVNFTDISSFQVQGRITYATKSDSTDFPVEGVNIKIDGVIAVGRDNRPIVTSSGGEFNVSVPIGKHYISVEKNGHVFNEGIFPGVDTNGLPELYDFNEAITGMQFYDNTRVLLSGRIVGGTKEGDKKIGFELSENNIGPAKVKLVPVKPYSLNKNTTENNFIEFTNDPVTGEYAQWIIPEEFNVESVSHSSYSFTEPAFTAKVDLRNALESITETDSVFQESFEDGEKIITFDSVRTYDYNLRRDWIYRAPPSLDVSSSGTDWLSDEEFELHNSDGTFTIPLQTENGGHLFPFPVFTQLRGYQWKLWVFEEYINSQTQKSSTVNVTDAEITISNNLAEPKNTLSVQTDQNGMANYAFVAGFPNTSIDDNKPENSFTLTTSMVAKTGSGEIANWPQNGVYRGYIMGGFPTGNNFITAGPNKADYILRDPPGSGSFASMERGTTTTTSSTVTINNGLEGEEVAVLTLGLETETQAGTPVLQVSTKIKSENNLGVNVEHSETFTDETTITSTTTFTEAFSTSDQPDFVGDQGDVFIGHSTNIIYGLSSDLRIADPSEIPVDGSQLDSEYQVEVDGKTLTIGVRKSLRVNPSFNTFFLYSQKQIIDNVIPNLKILRNLLFTNQPERYILNFDNFQDKKYATNNDDHIWGDGATSGDGVHNGMSYQFIPYQIDDENWSQDSVRFYNNQINNWEEVLADNERQKLRGIAGPGNKYPSNISFDAGATYEGSVETTGDTATIKSFEWTLNPAIVAEVGYSVNGFGFKRNMTERYTHNESEVDGETNSTSQTIGFTLSDADENNYYTVDVLKCTEGNGPIFRTKGGQSSCPYEGELKTKYFQPGTVLNQATVQIEKPVLNVDVPFIAGVPEDEPAIFRLNLRNQTEVVVDRWFLLKTDNASNPDGAKLYVDGAPLSSFGITIYIPAGRSVTKTLEVFKGAPEVNDYVGIILQLFPICEVDDTLAEAEAEIGVNFVAACSKVIVDVPRDNWIANVYNNDTIDIKLNGYNVNLSSFKSISLRAKDVATPTWTTLNTYYKNQSEFDAAQGSKELIGTRTTLNYKWDIKDIVDRDYEIQAVTTCTGENVFYESKIVRGVKDTKRPGPFGAPQPSNGVLSAGDEVVIQFDEPIISGLLLANRQFVTAKGVLNGTDYPNNTSLEFDGINDNAIVGDGVQLGNSSFTVEGWIRHNSNQEGTFWSLGETSTNQLKISFDASGKLVFKDGALSYTGNLSYQPGMWYHIALIYDINEKRILVYQDDKLDLDAQNATINSFPSGRMSFGYDLAQNTNYFNGRIRDFRIWTRALPFEVMYARKSATLGGNEPGLIGYWFMDEKFGNIAKDKSHLRNAVIDATWNVEPKGKSISLPGNSFVTIDGRNINIDDETDFTIEFWFNGQGNGDHCLLSSGRGTADEIFNTENSIAINASPSGIQVMSYGKSFQLTTLNLLDNNWHHLALVVNRRGSARGFIDGNQVSQADVTGFGGIGVGYLFLGARRWKDANDDYQVDRYFDGALDEVRFWKTARTGDQIISYRNHRVALNEAGLVGYYPFEKYEVDAFNVVQLIASLTDQWPGDDQTLNGDNAVLEGSAAFNEEVPTIGLLRPVKNIKYELTVNDDKVLISIDESLSLIENTLLEFSIRDVKDLHNNILASPVQWSAFVDKNQLKWETNAIKLDNEVGTETTFTARIRNYGGVSQSFFIDNLPEWLVASPTSGSLNAQTSTEITFTISEALNSGTYNEDLYLVADNGVDERLALTLKIFKQGPDWEVLPENYEVSMSVIGILKINDVISRNPNDIIAVFKDGEVRGVANLTYISQKDEYLIFLDIYGDPTEVNSALDLKVWNDDLGQINTGIQILNGSDLSESIIYKPGILLGSTSQPVQISVGNMQEQSVSYVAGWNWISLNLQTPDQSNTNLLFKSIDATIGDVVKSQPGPSDIYSGSTWIGQLSQTGFDNTSMYLLKLASKDTLVYSGVPLNPLEIPITLYPKWNWIGYIPNFSLPVSTALSNLNPEANDVIKGQRDFAIYDAGLGDWIGSLKSLKPSAGYQYYSNDGSIKEFTYPNNSVFSRSLEVIDRSPETTNQIFAQAYESNMNLIATVEGLDKYAENPWIVAMKYGEPVGSVAPVLVRGQYYYFMTIYGNKSKEELTFSLVFPRSGNMIRLDETMIYESNKVTGTLPDPFLFVLPETARITGNEMNVWPRPYSKNLNISFVLNDKRNVRIDMYDIGGRNLGKIYEGTFEKGQVDISLREQSAKAFEQIPGVYMLRVLLGDEVHSTLIIKQ